LHDRAIVIVPQLWLAAKALIDQHRRRWPEILLTVRQIRGLIAVIGAILHSLAMKYPIMEPALARRRAPLAATFRVSPSNGLL
jgi:hypothetical protein